MDGQGRLNDKAIISALKLTNFVIINYNFRELNDSDAIKDLCDKIEIIKESDS